MAVVRVAVVKMTLKINTKITIINNSNNSMNAMKMKENFLELNMKLLQN